MSDLTEIMGVPIVAKEAEDVEHRGAAEEVHGGAAEGAGAGTGAAGPIITFPNALTVSSAGAGYTNPSMITYGMGWVLAMRASRSAKSLRGALGGLWACDCKVCR